MAIPQAKTKRCSITDSVEPDLKDGCLLVPIGDVPDQRLLLRYRLEGPVDAPVVAVLGGLSAHCRTAEWWPELVGPDHPLAPERWRVLGIDWLHRRPGVNPPLLTRHQADALARLLGHLRIRRLHCLVGASYGAMVGLAFAERHGDRLARLVAISGAHESHPLATAWRCLQREIVRLGEYAGAQRTGLALARALAMTGYRSEGLFMERFRQSDPVERLCAVERYLSHVGLRFCEHFDATRFICLSESLDLHRATPERITCPVSLIGVDSDRLVPITQMHELHLRLTDSRLHEISSPYGHDAFLKEHRLIGELLEDALHQRTEVQPHAQA
jgi:homoserine O-acetyltransferase